MNGNFSFEFDEETYEVINWLWEHGGKFSKLLMRDETVVRYRKLRALAAVCAA